jgi:uncharacterized membrane protein YkvI
MMVMMIMMMMIIIIIIVIIIIIEIQRMWNVKTKVIPVIIAATGTISKSCTSAHHQEHRTVHTASGIVNQYCC